MKSIRLNLNQNSYDILLEQGGLSRIGNFVRPLVKGCKVFVITDDNVAKHYLETVKKSLEGAGFNVSSQVVPAGETSKNTGTFLELIDSLGKQEFLRDDIVVALGGGVVGDLAGFVAATYMRGINFVQVPTSLLAMIDSSIGGKVGVDLSYGKNLLGAFYQPKLVFVDVDVLGTLSEREWQNGLGEGLKYALLDGGRIFEIMDTLSVKSNLQEFVGLCAGYKAKIVEKDEKEAGLRRLLNLGHTLGHAIEKASEFTIPHGEAVKYGLKLILQASIKIENNSELQRGLALVEKYGADLPYDTKALLPLIKNDKKAEKDAINAVFVKNIGDCYVKKMSFEEFKELFE